MKKYTVYTAMFQILMYLSVYSQNFDSSCNSLQKHKWAVQFAVNGDFSIGAIDGLMFSLKRHLSSKSALRFGIGFSGNAGHSDDIDNGFSTTEKGNFENINLVCSYLYYFNPKGILNIYFGAGPRLSYQHSYRESPDYEFLYLTDYSKSNTWSAGVQATFGAECFPLKYLSFFAEYTAYGEFQRSTFSGNEYNESSNQVINKSGSTTGWRIEANTARLGISLYF